MKQDPGCEKRVAQILKKMKLAMPEIRHQVEVYEKNLVHDRNVNAPKVVSRSGNV